MFGRKEIKIKAIYDFDKVDSNYLYFNERMVIVVDYQDVTYCYFREYLKYCYNRFFWSKKSKQKIYYICG